MLANDLYLHDGFQESFKFRGHRLQIRGFNSLESYDGKTRNQSQQNNEIRAKEIYISWDIKQVLLWEQNYSDADNLRVVSTLRFPKNQPNFISAIVNIPRLKIFVAAALDMSFKIYDKNLHLLESIKHHERAILQMEYDGEKDLFITSGGSGISLWRIIRVVSLDIAHVVEKLYSFEECSSWVGKMIYEPSANRIYAIIDRNAQVFSFSKKRMIHELVDTHTSPLTVVCWYERNQFYLTGCSHGEIKCWTSNYSQKRSSQYQQSSKTFALLHVFKSHGRAVTAIKLHPVSGLAITAAMDGVIKVLNLQALTELFAITLSTPVLDLKIISLGSGQNGCLFSAADTTINLYRITSCCSFFSVSTAKISTIRKFGSIQANGLATHSIQRSDSHTALHKSDSEVKAFTAYENKNSEITYGQSLGEISSINNDHSAVENLDEGEIDNVEEQAVAKVKSKNFIVGYSTQDLAVYNDTGKVVSRMEPDDLVQGIRNFVVSFYQQILFCIYEEVDVIRLFDICKPTCPFLLEVPIRGNALERNLATCLELIGVLPFPILKSADPGRMHSKMNSRGDYIAPEVEEFLLIGLKNGCVLFLDTLNNFDIHFSLQAHTGVIRQLNFRKQRNELIVLGGNAYDNISSVKIWKFPEVVLVNEVLDLKYITALGFSTLFSHFAVGSKEGFLKLYNSPTGNNSCHEIVRSDDTHDDSVLSITFCDEVRVFASCSLDQTVRVWDFEKKFIRCIRLNLVPSGIVMNGLPGDILLGIGFYLLVIDKHIWDAGDRLAHIHSLLEGWDAVSSGDANSAGELLLQQIEDGTLGKQALGESLNIQKDSEELSIDRNRLDPISPPVQEDALPAFDQIPIQPPVKSSTSSPKNRKKFNAAIDGSASEATGPLIDASTSRESSITKPGKDAAQDTQRAHPPNVTNHSLPPVNRRMSKFITPQSKPIIFSAQRARPSPLGGLNTEEDRDNMPHRDADSSEKEEVSHTVESYNSNVGTVVELLPSQISRKNMIRYEYVTKQNNTIYDPSATFYDASKYVDGVFGGLSAIEQESSTDTGSKVSIGHLDVLHPRFLIKKKPSVVAVKDRELEKLELISTRTGQQNVKQDSSIPSNEHDRVHDKESIQVSAKGPLSRRIAQIGLSPRARLTLLNTNVNDGDANKLHEQMLLAAVEMKVSDSYKEQRQALLNTSDSPRSRVLHGSLETKLEESHKGAALEEPINIDVVETNEHSAVSKKANNSPKRRMSIAEKKRSLLVRGVPNPLAEPFDFTAYDRKVKSEVPVVSDNSEIDIESQTGRSSFLNKPGNMTIDSSSTAVIDYSLLSPTARAALQSKVANSRSFDFDYNSKSNYIEEGSLTSNASQSSRRRKLL